MNKFAAIGASGALLALTLTPAALAAGTARVGSSGAGAAATVPTTTIKGKPAKFSPSSLSAKAKGTGTTCTSAQASFEMLNKKSKSQKVNFTGTGGVKGSVTVAAHKGEFICITKGYTGTLTGKLKDGKKLTVKF